MIQFIVKGNFDNTPKGFKEKNGHYIADFESLTIEERRELKKHYPQGYFRLGFWEKGGGNFEDGEATIVCGLEGEKLKPVKVRNRGWLANSRHALFIGNELCMIHIKAEKRNVEISLKKYSIKLKIGILEEETIWEGSREDLSELSEDLRPFREALETAVEKVFEYRCTKAMYYLREEK